MTEYEPTHTPQPENSTDYTPDIENMTLAQAFGRLWSQPRRTLAAIHRVATTPRTTPIEIPSDTSSRPAPAAPPSLADSPLETDSATDEYQPINRPTDTDADTFQAVTTGAERRLELITLGVRLTAFLLAWIGNLSLNSVSRGGGDGNTVERGLFFVGAGVALWLGSEVYTRWPDIIRWWQERGRSTGRPAAAEPLSDWLHPLRIGLAVVGGVGILLTLVFSRGNQFTLPGFIAWMVSITAVAMSLASDEFLFGGWRRWRVPRFWRSKTFYALIAIMLVGAYFRLAYLPQTPPQMTSDHVEKLLDAQRVLEGNTQIFFPNNGGREPLQMYLMALLSLIPGLGMDFTTLKLLSALEGIFTLPILWWMGREVVGRESPRLGNTVGLILALLVAVSHWHVSLSRLALRIVLTPPIAALLLIYLGRGLRDNRRDDWLKAGLVLGAGLYMYQAVRMLPVVVIAGTLIAVVAQVRRRAALWRYAVNFTSLVVVSFVVFVPMFIFSVQYSDQYWQRTSGRLLGDATIQEEQPDGTLTERDATFTERVDAFQGNLPVLGNNVKNVLLMFNWKGDVAWINNAPNAPQMDALVGALFLLGLAAWAVRMIARRDVLDWLVPVMLFLMLLPSALAIAYPVENPSATRTSGALPVAYLLAAYPLALMVRPLMRLNRRRALGVGLSAALVSAVAFGSYLQNTDTYFNEYHDNYLLSSLPYRQAGAQIQDFNEQVDGRGNTFMIAYPYWWDHRALGIAGGMIDYPNGIVELDNVPQFLQDSLNREGEYSLHPDRNMLFFLSPEDVNGMEKLQNWFPQGQPNIVEIPQQRRSYATYRVPAVGEQRLRAFFEQHIPPDAE